MRIKKRARRPDAFVAQSFEEIVIGLELACSGEAGAKLAEFQPRVRTFIDPRAGELAFTTSELQVPASQEARLIVYTPADDETRKRLPPSKRTQK